MKAILSLIFVPIVLMMIPSAFAQAQIAALTPTPQPVPMIYTQCIDFNQDRICEYVVLANGTMIANPAIQQQAAPMSQLVERQKVIIKEQQRDNDDDNDNDNDDNNNKLPYCDQDDSGACFDSRDYDQVTGLFPCRDGSQVADYRDCPDRGGDDEDNNDNDNDNDSSRDDEEEEEENTSNCGGEPCTATEKEDSWTDEEAGNEEEP
jgi:hypothetical protein